MKKIAVLAAMQEELNACKNLLGGNERFSFFLSGVGRANTAMNAALIIKEHNPDLILNVGTAGGLHAEQKILDVVIPSEIVGVDVDVTALGFEYGQMLGEPASYFTDKDLQQKLFEVSKGIVTTHSGTVGSSEAFICKPEQVAEIHRRFNNRVVCVEMEAFSIGVVCNKFKVPFAVIRSLSDVPAHGEGNELNFNEFLKAASDNAAKILFEFSRNFQNL